MIGPWGVPLFLCLRGGRRYRPTGDPRKRKVAKQHVPMRRGRAAHYRCPFSPLNPWAWSLPQETNMECGADMSGIPPARASSRTSGGAVLPRTKTMTLTPAMLAVRIT